MKSAVSTAHGTAVKRGRTFFLWMNIPVQSIWPWTPAIPTRSSRPCTSDDERAGGSMEADLEAVFIVRRMRERTGSNSLKDYPKETRAGSASMYSDKTVMWCTPWLRLMHAGRAGVVEDAAAVAELHAAACSVPLTAVTPGRRCPIRTRGRCTIPKCGLIRVTLTASMCSGAHLWCQMMPGDHSGATVLHKSMSITTHYGSTPMILIILF